MESVLLFGFLPSGVPAKERASPGWVDAIRDVPRSQDSSLRVQQGSAVRWVRRVHGAPSESPPLRGPCARRVHKYTTSSAGLSSLSFGLCVLKHVPMIFEFTAVSNMNTVVFGPLGAWFPLCAIWRLGSLEARPCWDLPGDVAHFLKIHLFRRMEKKWVQREGKVNCNGGWTGPQPTPQGALSIGPKTASCAGRRWPGPHTPTEIRRPPPPELSQGHDKYSLSFLPMPI